MKRVVVGAALSLVFSSVACTPSAPVDSDPVSPALTIEDILAIRETTAPRWSPHGRYVAFTWSTGLERELWLADAENLQAASPGDPGLRQAAPLVGRAGMALSPDWRAMAYVANRHIWTLPLNGGVRRRLSSVEGTYSGLNWSPDASHLAFVVERNGQTDIGLVSESGGDMRFIADSQWDEDSPIWSPDGDRLAFLRRFIDWGGYEIWVTSADRSWSRAIVTETYERGIDEFHFGGNHHWSPDGMKLVYLSSRTGYNHLWVVSTAGGAPTEVTTGSFADAMPAWAPQGHLIAFVSSRAGPLEERHLWLVSAAGGEPVRLSSNGFVTNPVWAPDGSRIAYLRSSGSEPPEIVVQAAEAGARVRRLTASNPAPGLTRSFAEPEAVRYRSRDGKEIPAVLLRPGGPNAPAPRAGLVFLHGKAGINLKGWDGLPFYAFHQLLVRQGYAVLFINWRGTYVGYGAEFERANYRDYGGGELEDVLAGAEYLAKQVGVDPARIACWGTSYGGYLVMLAMTKAPGVFNGGISAYGVSDWAQFFDQTKRALWRLRLTAKLGDPKQHQELYERAAPLRFVKGARDPMLIVHGVDDDGVSPAQSESFFEALNAAGKPAMYVAYTGEGHGFRSTGSLRDLYSRVLDFLAERNPRSAELPAP